MDTCICGAKKKKNDGGKTWDVFECDTFAHRGIITTRTQICCENEIKNLKKVLAFYAEPKNWLSKSKGFALQYDPEPSEIQKDKGELARMTLSQTKEK